MPERQQCSIFIFFAQLQQSHCLTFLLQKKMEVRNIAGEAKSAKFGRATQAEDSSMEYYCGIWKFRPKCLQVFRSSYVFAFLLCCDIFFGGALGTGFISVTLSSIQRRYNLNATQSGLVVSVYDMAVIVSVVFVSYFGGKGHKPRWLGIGLLIQGLGALIYALPQFVFGNYGSSTATISGTEVCVGLEMNDSNFTHFQSKQCHEDSINGYVLLFFIAGNMLIGFGASPVLPIGASFLDDIIMPKYVPIYFGFYFVSVLLGPALGYGLGSAFLSIYVDFWERTDLKPTDPAFVGAWWISFLFSSIMCWLVAVPILMFPRLLPDSHLVKKERQKLINQHQHEPDHDSSDEKSTLCTVIRSFVHQVWCVISTPSWLFITISISIGAFAVQGLASFSPLYFEIQFNLTSSTASVIGGSVLLVPGALGALIGGIIIVCVKDSGRRVALIIWVVLLVSIPPLLSYLVHCPTLDLAGVTQPYARDQFLIKSPYYPINASCTQSCNCNFQSNIYQPVCGGDGLTYTSPCRAGCSVTFNEHMKAVYESCSCVEDNLRLQMPFSNFTEQEIINMSVVSDGSCDDGCSALALFVVLSVIVVLMLTIIAVPDLVVTMRCVSDDHRALALGVQSTIFRIFGYVPGPIVFGVALDESCKFWNYEFPCESSTPVLGACWEYDKEQLSNSFLIMTVVASCLSCLFSFFSWLTYPSTPSKDREESLSKQNVKKTIREEDERETSEEEEETNEETATP